MSSHATMAERVQSDRALWASLILSGQLGMDEHVSLHAVRRLYLRALDSLELLGALEESADGHGAQGEPATPLGSRVMKQPSVDAEDEPDE